MAVRVYGQNGRLQQVKNGVAKVRSTALRSHAHTAVLSKVNLALFTFGASYENFSRDFISDHQAKPAEPYPHDIPII